MVELTHIDRLGGELYRQTQKFGGPLPWANETLALRDANRTGRAKNLILRLQASPICIWVNFLIAWTKL
jgi:hypothetical protein